ncbi:acyl-CoA synthetase (AMP-forming)/AMP-acid ligase II [Halarchaeum rubridurum]|uniref:Acyl-CoA synthetase (AMP-forming)/AMP-acid ligase II n=1 Tax=Halarchaeum rubridurum TaxID=489911 RepID=A0A830FL84_9EURY|nr:class I adenylate-forming enzyme family protein [Halarchaeum rubridurum]MBP1954508.1 acyl-CoA synthetase (AMP-forming)/AMP-acid ligase II [Halarchaeum rubridurum]GGM61649.1 long-chain-fatty-acid--CoA ligase [Halarchaeum rubridurum]
MQHGSEHDVPAIRDLSAIAAENNPNGTAFGTGVDGRTMTWEEFDRESNRVANGLREYVAQGDRVAMLCQNSLDHVSLWNGALKAGCTVSNLHIRASPNTVQHCIDELRPRVLVVDERTAEFFEERVREKISTDLAAVITLADPQADYEQSKADLIEGQSAAEPDVRVNEDDLAAVLWTSGTTGQPKGWCFTNRALYLRGSTLVDVAEVNRSSRQPNTFTPSFAAWYSVMLPALVSGAETHFLSNWDVETYLDMIEEHELTTGMLVPTMWREILRSDALEEHDVSSLDAITSAGEVLDATTLRNLREKLCSDVKNMYAATESFSTVMQNAELNEERVESVGKPVPGVRLRIVEEGGSYDDVVPQGEVGELVINAPDAPVWAWGNTQKTDASFEDGWWYSGDLGYRSEDGFIYLEGRSDLMILSKGIKVYPAPIEERLNEHPGVEEAAIVGVKDEEYGEKVTAYVNRSDPDVTADDLDDWCIASDNLSRMERPRTYHFVDEPLPRTATGKLDRLSAKQLGDDE